MVWLGRLWALLTAATLVAIVWTFTSSGCVPVRIPPRALPEPFNIESDTCTVVDLSLRQFTAQGLDGRGRNRAYALCQEQGIAVCWLWRCTTLGITDL